MLGYRLRHEKVVLQRRQGGTSGVRPGDDDTTGEDGDGQQNTETTTTTVVRTRTTATTTSSATSSVIVQQTTTSTTERVQATSSTTTTTSSIVETTTSTTPTSTVVSTSSTTSTTNLLPTTATARVTSTGTRTIPLATIATPSTSATAGAANAGSSAPVGTIIGIIAAGLVGVVVIAAGLGWLFRRYFSKKDNYRSDFMRNSVAIPDDYNEKPPMGSKNALNLARQNAYMDGPSTNPRPPTMIERRLNATGNAGFQPGEVIPQQDNNGYYADPNAGYYDQGQYGYNQQYGQYPDPQHMGYPPQVGGAAYYNDYNQYGAEGHYPAGQDPYYGQDGQYTHNAYQQQQYSDIQHQLDHGMAPAGAAPGAPQERSLTNNAPAAAGGANYASLTAAAGLDATERSGTPVDRNPQQAYLPSAGDSRRLAAGQNQAGTQMPVKRESFNGDDAYGGM